MNLPGRPVLATTDRGEAITEVAPVSLYIWNGTRVVGPTTFDPRAYTFPNWDKFYALTNTAEEGVNGSPIPTKIDTKPTVWEADINRESPASAFQSLVGASGSNWVTYHLLALQPHEKWNITTYYFGNRTSQEAGGYLSASGLGYGGVWYYKSEPLTMFRHAPVQAVGEMYWVEAPPPIAKSKWPLERPKD